LFDLAIAPDDPERLLAATEDGLFTSTVAARSWRPTGDAVGLVAGEKENPTSRPDEDPVRTRS
jgi:hypothetical protein